MPAELGSRLLAADCLDGWQVVVVVEGAGIVVRAEHVARLGELPDSGVGIVVVFAVVKGRSHVQHLLHGGPVEARALQLRDVVGYRKGRVNEAVGNEDGCHGAGEGLGDRHGGMRRTSAGT